MLHCCFFLCILLALGAAAKTIAAVSEAEQDHGSQHLERRARQKARPSSTATSNVAPKESINRSNVAPKKSINRCNIAPKESINRCNVGPHDSTVRSERALAIFFIAKTLPLARIFFSGFDSLPPL
ncbi:hypothetical protein FA10DRAFT_262798 [Acaromyces ingoldii]|uniref:Secreted protein n=1 Tax=Acaromyces ingoldii TaxID=215250 RepID=A0A316YCU2_9BASI|nr:hypothetical protein FA10DRAFT_262798 [Acaromyces ingoldii]PWN87011.1 hypothetical protein FA10DRAFT_262798 [Acaromyces ingoldii]